jgi:hypothetical protein
MKNETEMVEIVTAQSYTDMLCHAVADCVRTADTLAFHDFNLLRSGMLLKRMNDQLQTILPLMLRRKSRVIFF